MIHRLILVIWQERRVRQSGTPQTQSYCRILRAFPGAAELSGTGRYDPGPRILAGRQPARPEQSAGRGTADAADPADAVRGRAVRHLWGTAAPAVVVLADDRVHDDRHNGLDLHLRAVRAAVDRMADHRAGLRHRCVAVPQKPEHPAVAECDTGVTKRRKAQILPARSAWVRPRSRPCRHCLLATASSR